MIKVMARKGIQVPLEDNPARYVTDEKPVDAPPERRRSASSYRHGAIVPTEKAEKTAGKSAAPAAKADK